MSPSILYPLAALLVDPASPSPPNLLFATPFSIRQCDDVRHQQLAAHLMTAPPRREHPSGRRWKARRGRGAFLPPPIRDVFPAEERALEDQLGYLPPNVCNVSARSGDASAAVAQDRINDDAPLDTTSEGAGRPIAIRSYPLLIQRPANHVAIESEDNDHLDAYDVTPFPTMHWLTCPHVSRAISELERRGHVRNFQSKLEGDPDLAKEWWECHEEHASERWSLLSESDADWLSQKGREGMRDMVKRSGVAGTDHRGLRGGGSATDFVPSVKCLHSHYAHYRSQLSRSNAINAEEGGRKTKKFNLVGRWTHELLLENFPDILF